MRGKEHVFPLVTWAVLMRYDRGSDGTDLLPGFLKPAPEYNISISLPTGDTFTS